MKSETAILTNKIAHILLSLSSSKNGMRLKELVLETGIAHASTHRILNDLIKVGFVQQLDNKIYQLGPELFTLGLSAPIPILDLNNLEKFAQELADECGNLVCIGLKQFNGVRYISVCKGGNPIIPYIINKGDLKPFTATFSGLALLAYLKEGDQRNWIQKPQLEAPVEWILANHLNFKKTIPNLIDKMKKDNYIYAQNLVYPNVSGITTVIPTKNAEIPYMTLSISAVNDKLQPEKADELIPKLIRTANKMSKLIY
ncbi:helix-turn-helix domain-containing protein [Acinetobacter calcoaceticus]|uniref:helix-turn-helix domain-containing protein n=1 Tax=Acinetobacter calcoaceticus TaxID=471 RepID=UPI002B3237F2|nr:helix-turn-helix domain-containing protein [Acinetobacter baumannii]